MRAFLVVNCQSALVWLALRSCSQAAISSMRICLLGMRRSSSKDDRETWADVADLHECLARTIETNFAKAAHALDIRRLQNRKHLVTASVDDRLRGCRHDKRGLYITAASHGAIRTMASRSEN